MEEGACEVWSRMDNRKGGLVCSESQRQIQMRCNAIHCNAKVQCNSSAMQRTCNTNALHCQSREMWSGVQRNADTDFAIQCGAAMHLYVHTKKHMQSTNALHNKAMKRSAMHAIQCACTSLFLRCTSLQVDACNAIQMHKHTYMQTA